MVDSLASPEPEEDDEDVRYPRYDLMLERWNEGPKETKEPEHQHEPYPANCFCEVVRNEPRCFRCGLWIGLVTVFYPDCKRPRCEACGR